MEYGPLITLVVCLCLMLALLYAVSQAEREAEIKKLNEITRRREEGFHEVGDAFPSWFRESEQKMKRRLKR